MELVFLYSSVKAKTSFITLTPVINFINILCSLLKTVSKQASLSTAIHTPMQCFQNALAYFAIAVSYTHKMLM
jgi:hypothetical protein